MPQLDFTIDSSELVAFAATPTIAFKLRILNSGSTPGIHNVALRCQIQIESARRRYTADEQSRLNDLFGEPSRWGQTLRPMLWTDISTIVPAFKGETIFDLLVPCTFDFNLAATKYFAGLTDGEIPLCFLFSGSTFYEGDGGRLQVEQISWNKEATYRLPVALWRHMMETFYPNERWLLVHSEVFDRISRYKQQRGIPTWDQAFESLLSAAETAVPARKAP